jgi:hypothetical protein
MARTLFAAVFICALGSGSADAQRDALFDRLAHDFGPIPRGPSQTTSFTVTNKSAGPIHIAGVRIPCACVSARVSKNDLKAGESTTVVVNLDTRRVSGQISKTFFVQLDRPQREEVGLTIKANIREDLIVAPDHLDFGRVKRGGSKTASVTVLLAGKAAAKNVNVKSDSEFVQAKIRQLPPDSNGVSYEVTARLQPDLPEGLWYSTVWLSTDNPSLPRFPIAVAVEIMGAGKGK